MRMWMVSPRIMCGKHLIGEHRELHTLEGAIRDPEMRVFGWANKGLVDPSSIVERHGVLVEEFARRGWPSGKCHETPIGPLDLSGVQEVDIDLRYNLTDLVGRCDQCAFRLSELVYDKIEKHRAVGRGWLSEAVADQLEVDFLDLLLQGALQQDRD